MGFLRHGSGVQRQLPLEQLDVVQLTLLERRQALLGSNLPRDVQVSGASTAHRVLAVRTVGECLVQAPLDTGTMP